MKNKKKTNININDYKEYFKDPKDIELFNTFFNDLDKKIVVAKAFKDQMINDFKNAIIVYKTKYNLSAKEILERLDLNNLGGFYSRDSKLWFDLDDSAKIYPLAMKHGFMSVFRLSAYIKEDVIPEILQMALNFTIKRFPLFATTVKCGFFWHYLDVTKRRFYIEEDLDIPVSQIQVGLTGSQSFKVLYYKNRISVEFFHILTDGTGGSVFFKTLICEYFKLLGVDFNNKEILDINDIVNIEETEDNFKKVDKSNKAEGFVDKPALQYDGKLSKNLPCRVLHFKMNCNKLKEVANSKGGTITDYILSKMFIASRKATDLTSGDFQIQIPVNLRKYYPSKTLRNFTMFCGVRFAAKDIKNADEMVNDIDCQLKENSSKNKMDEMVNAARLLTSSVRIVPLFLKSWAINKIYNFFGDNAYSNTLSNLGVVDFPDPISKQILSMDFILGTTYTNRCSCSLISCNNISTFTISKNTYDSSFEESMYEQLIKDGIEVEVEGSELYED